MTRVKEIWEKKRLTKAELAVIRKYLELQSCTNLYVQNNADKIRQRLCSLLRLGNIESNDLSVAGRVVAFLEELLT